MPPISRIFKRNKLPSKMFSWRHRGDWAITISLATIIPMFMFFSLFEGAGGRAVDAKVREELDRVSLLEGLQITEQVDGNGMTVISD